MVNKNRSSVSDDDFKKKLKSALDKKIYEQVCEKHEDYFESKLQDASSSVRLSISTKHKLKRMMKSSETFDELIIRLIDENKEFHKEIRNWRRLPLENEHVVNYFEKLYKRVKQIFSYHPDLKIEYSYNELRMRFDGRHSFHLKIDKYIYQGKEICEDDAIKIIQSISIIQSVNKTDALPDIEQFIKEKHKLLDNPYELLKTKYLVYFKILYLIITKKHNTLQDATFLNIDFWKVLYSRKELSKESFHVDVKTKFQKFDAQVNQLNVTRQRSMWDFKIE